MSALIGHYIDRQKWRTLALWKKVYTVCGLSLCVIAIIWTLVYLS